MLTDRRCPPQRNTLPASGGAGPQVRVAADVVAGTFVRVFASLVARVPCESVHERGPRSSIPPSHAPRGSSPRAAAARARPQPTGASMPFAQATGQAIAFGLRQRRACTQKALPARSCGSSDPHRACPSRRHGEPRVRTIRQGLLAAPDAHATDPLDAGVGSQVWLCSDVAALAVARETRACRGAPRCGRRCAVPFVRVLSAARTPKGRPGQPRAVRGGDFRGTAAVAAAAVRRQASIGQAILDDHPATVLHLLHAGDGRGQMVAL